MSAVHVPYLVSSMTLADVAEAAALEKRVFALPWSRRAFEYEIQRNPMSHFLVIRARGQPMTPTCHTPLLGYGGFWLIIDEGHVCTLAVKPEWRGRGLGELLLSNLIDRALAVEARTMTLEVRSSNTVAQSLYRKYGFAAAGVRKGYYADNGEDALIMTTECLTTAGYQRRFQALKALLARRLARPLVLPQDEQANAPG
jgi:ribosomal-protein-alanine N-acetyltransferase